MVYLPTFLRIHATDGAQKVCPIRPSFSQKGEMFTWSWRSQFHHRTLKYHFRFSSSLFGHVLGCLFSVRHVYTWFVNVLIC